MGDSAMATGLTSFATGYKTLASGDYATATGNQTTASGQSAFSGGFGTVASQIASTAFGFVSQATGVSSLASGYSTIAAGENSVAMNSVTRALGPNSVTSGFLTKTIGWASSAFGESNTARAYASAVFGRYNDTIATSDPNTWVSLDPLFMIGNGSANTERNNALTIYKDGNLIAKHPTAVTSDPGILPLPVSGPGTRMMWIPGKSAFRIGTVNNDSWDAGNIGVSSFASGFNSKATGSLSTAFGESTASGSLSTALGQSNATATASTSMGLFTKATGFGSTAMGHYAIASGSFSTSMGYGTIAKAYLSTAIGSYNDSIAGSSELTWNEADPLFYVGNGINDATRHNALTIYKNANTDISGYTRLGEESENAPRIKMKELPLTTAGVNYNSSVTLPHGLTVSKILSVSVLIEWDDNYWAPPEYSSSLNRRYSYYVSPTDIVVQNNTPSGDCLICERPVRVLITYKE